MMRDVLVLDSRGLKPRAKRFLLCRSIRNSAGQARFRIEGCPDLDVGYVWERIV